MGGQRFKEMTQHEFYHPHPESGAPDFYHTPSTHLHLTSLPPTLQHTHEVELPIHVLFYQIAEYE